MSHIFRNLIICFVYTVGVGIFERLNLCTVLVDDRSRISFRQNIFSRYIRRIIYDMFYKYNASDNTYDCKKEYTQDKSLEKSDTDALCFHSLFRRDLVLSF